MKRHVSPTPKVFNASYKPPQKTKQKLPQILSRPLLLAVAIVATIFLIGRLPILRIGKIEFEGRISTESQDRLKQLVGQSIFSNKINFVIDSVLSADSTISEINCVKSIPSTLNCQIEARVGEFIWNTQEKKYLIDKQGYVFKSASNEKLKVITDRKSKDVVLGELVISPETLTTFSDLLKQLSAASIKVDQLFIDESFYQFEVILTGRVDKKLPFPKKLPINVLLTTSYPISSQVKVLTQLLSEHSEKITKRIDLRVPGNVYYQ